jgi:ribosomal protein L32
MKTAVKKTKTAKSKKAVRKTGFEDLDMKDFSKDPYGECKMNCVKS